MSAMEGDLLPSYGKTPGWIAREEQRARASRVTRRLESERIGSSLYQELKAFKPQRPSLPPPPRPQSVAEALARLADGRAQLWTCSIRDELIADGLVEVTYRECGRWNGDKITPKGRKALKRERSA